MKPTTSTLLLTLVAAVPPGADAGAQELPDPVTIDQAVALFRQNSPQLEIARDRLLGSMGIARQGRAVPNLAAQFTHEDLGDYSESYLLFTQRLEFLWEQGRRSDRAEGQTLAASARFQADSTVLATDVKRAFVTAWERAEAVTVFSRAEQEVEQLIASAQARVAEGDLAGYDLRRLRWERALISRRRAAASLDREDAERRLGVYVSEADSALRVGAAGLDPDGPPSTADLDVQALALTRRPELRAATATRAALEAEAGLASASWLSGTSATGGYKRQSDDLEGWFVGLAVPLPLTDRRQGASDAARAAVRVADGQTSLLARAVSRETSVAEARLASARSQRALLGPDAVTAAEELLGIARLSYEEGEVGIVELLDATRAFLEARLLFLSVQADAWNAYFELEAAVGGFPTDDETGASDR